MGTRSLIAYHNENDIDYIYCHYDGYVEHNGRILFEHYQNETKVKELISLGDISYLDMYVSPLGGDHTFNDPEKDVTIAYHRDRGEDKNIGKANDIVRLVDRAKDCGAEYLYYYKNSTWFVYDLNNGTKFTKLSELFKTKLNVYGSSIVGKE